jgi:Phosphoesterase family
MDSQFIANDPPDPNGQPLDPVFQMGVTWSHGISELGQFTTWFGLGVYLKDINSELLSLVVNSGDNQTPLTMTLQFETDGPEEVQGSISMDVIKFLIVVRLTLRFHEPTAADLFGWVDDINAITYTPQSVGPTTIYTVSGTFLGQPVSGQTNDPGEFRTQLIGKVVDVVFTTSAALDPGGAVQKRIREGIFNRLSDADAITKVTLRDSLNATASSWLIGGVIASGAGELLPYENPCMLQAVSVANDILTLNYISPEKTFVYQASPDWPTLLAPGALAEIDHIVVLAQENRSFDHMLGYLSLPLEKGGMNRKDVDGLKGGEFNMFNGRKIQSFRLAAGDTIFSPGPPNSSERTAQQVNGGKMDSFVQPQADECGPATAHRVMGYHTADNVPTYDSLARDFAICHRWFAPHPGDIPEPLLRAHGKAEHRPVGSVGIRELEPAPTRAHGHDLRFSDRARGLLDLFRALLYVPPLLRTAHLRFAERCRLQRSRARVSRSREIRQPAFGVVRRSAFRRLSAGQLLRRAPLRPPQQPALHPEARRGGGGWSEMGEDAAHHHL